MSWWDKYISTLVSPSFYILSDHIICVTQIKKRLVVWRKQQVDSSRWFPFGNRMPRLIRISFGKTRANHQRYIHISWKMKPPCINLYDLCVQRTWHPTNHHRTIALGRALCWNRCILGISDQHHGNISNRDGTGSGQFMHADKVL